MRIYLFICGVLFSGAVFSQPVSGGEIFLIPFLLCAPIGLVVAIVRTKKYYKTEADVNTVGLVGVFVGRFIEGVMLSCVAIAVGGYLLVQLFM